MPALVLIHPDIPQNLGGILRLCACLNLPLHVIEPCGFPFDDARLRRSGMDYIAHAPLHRHRSWEHYTHSLFSQPSSLLKDTSHSRDRGDTQGEQSQNDANQQPEEGGATPRSTPSCLRHAQTRKILIETDGTASLGDFTFHPGDQLIFGSESAGTPRDLYADMDATLRVPMREGLRSFNVAMTAGIVAYEAWRQLRWPL